MAKNKTLWIVSLCLALILAALALYQWNYLRIAHSTFDNYYAFRGCRQLVSRTESSGTCKLADGQMITIVEFDGKWYLEGDLPWACIGHFCAGI